MEQTGIAVDVDHLQSLEAEFAGGVKLAAEEAFGAIGKEINLGSPKQLQVVLFDELGMPKTKRTKTGYTTDADALVTLLAKVEEGSTGARFLAGLLRHRDVARLRQTIEGLLKTVADRRSHPHDVQPADRRDRPALVAPTPTSRTSRSAPRRVAASARASSWATATSRLMTADYSQIEMRIMADLSEDAVLIEAFQSGRDFHSITAARVFDVPADEVTPGQRAKIKAMNYGLAYGLSAFGLGAQLRIHPSEAQVLMDEYFETFGGVRDYLSSVVDEARRTGYTETILGRRRYLPDLTVRQPPAPRDGRADGPQRPDPGLGRRPHQGRDAARRTTRTVTPGLRSRMLLQVHDELVFEVVPGEREAFEALVREQMGGAASLAVPLDVSIGTGHSWHEAAH